MNNNNLKGAIQERLIGILRRPPQSKRKPSNAALWVAYAFFNLVFAFLDFITAITVAVMLNNFLYGALTFLAGFAPMFMHEFLFIRAYATKWQKGISVFGAILGVASTLILGVAAGAINVFKVSAVLSPVYMELAVASALVLVAGVHAVLAMTYFYIDDGIRQTHRRQEAVAYHERQKQGIEDAKEIVLSVKSINDVFETYLSNGEGGLLAAAFQDVTGNALIDEEKPIPVYSDKPFVVKQAVSASPLPQVDDAKK